MAVALDHVITAQAYWLSSSGGLKEETIREKGWKMELPAEKIKVPKFIGSRAVRIIKGRAEIILYHNKPDVFREKK